MGVFRQLGDPVCPDCLCQHHRAEFITRPGETEMEQIWFTYDTLSPDTVVLSRTISTTERCCIVVNAATVTRSTTAATALEIERPLGSPITTQEADILSGDIHLQHHAAWEVLDPGTYTYYLVNRSGGLLDMFAAWIKVIASDCEA